MSKIIFRCLNCEKINEIPSQYFHRTCKRCGKIVSYSQDNAFFIDQDSDMDEYYKFMKGKRLTNKLAKDFFSLVDRDRTIMSKLLSREKREIELPIIKSSSSYEIFLELVRDHNYTTLDDLIFIWEKLGYKKDKLEALLKFMNEQGIIYKPKPWKLDIL